MEKIISVWEGVFNSFADAGGNTDAFADEQLIKKNQEKIIASLDSPPYSKDYPLSVAVAMLLTQYNHIGILDFGGGMGLQYIDLIKKVPAAITKVAYHVIDNEHIIKNIPYRLNQLIRFDLKQHAALKFYDSIENVSTEINLIHFGSVLQYIEDANELITTLYKKFKPNYFIFSDLIVGDVPNFVSHQLYYDKKIPMKFLNINEFKVFMEELGFSLIYDSKFITPIIGQEKIYPNHSLPEEYRIDRTSNFIFIKK